MGPILNPFGLALSVLILPLILGMLAWVLVRRSRGTSTARANDSSAESKPILVQVASSLASERALELACDIATEMRGRIILTHVLELPLSLQLDAPVPELEMKAQDILNRAALAVNRRHLMCESQIVRERTAAAGIVQLAREANASMLVIGFDGSIENGLDDLVAVSALFRHAPCEILIARGPVPLEQSRIPMGQLINPSLHG